MARAVRGLRHSADGGVRQPWKYDQVTNSNESSRPFAFHGFTGKRRVISYGWKCDFEERAIRQADDIPGWLSPLREVAAGFAGIGPEELQQALVTEYDVGAAIGWHRDKAVFGDVIGISLLSSCRFWLERRLVRTLRVSAPGTVADGVGTQHSGSGRPSLFDHLSESSPGFLE